MSSSSPITFSLVLIFFTSEGWKIIKQSKVVRVFFKTGPYFISLAAFKLGISQSWIIIHFCLQFWSNKAKHNFRNHDTQRRAIDFNYRTSIGLFANIYPSSFILHRLTWAHQSPFLPEFMNDFNILNFRALVLINQRDSEEGCSKTRDTRCPVYSIARF